MSSYYRKTLEDWLKNLHIEADKVADFGGSQNPIGPKRTGSWNVKDVKIVDLPQPHINSPEPDIELDLNYPLTLSVESYCVNRFHSSDHLNDFIEKWYGYFDVAFCLEITEYLFNPLLALQHVNNFLKLGGHLYISFPMCYGIHNPAGLDYLRYTPDGAERLLKEAGFEVIQHKHRTPKPGNSIERFYAQDGMRYRKDTDQEITGSLIKARKI